MYKFRYPYTFNYDYENIFLQYTIIINGVIFYEFSKLFDFYKIYCVTSNTYLSL